MLKSLKTLLGLSLLGFFGVWIGCSSDSSPVAPYSASKAQDTSPTPGMTGVDLTEVSFTDNNLKYEVALAIFPAAIVPPAATFGTTAFTITRADLRSLEVLKASEKGIANLSGLEWATNLDTLVLSGNSITDVAPLAGLTNLEYLDLNKNGITILTPLSGLTNLEYLDLQRQYNKSMPKGSRTIMDVTPLAGLTNLKRLHLYTNDIRDISSLASLTKLTHFGIGGSDGGDVGKNLSQEGLAANWPDLVWLKVNQILLTDISFLEGLPKLEWLNISGNWRLRDLKPLVCLPKLKTLHVKNMHAATIGNASVGYNVHIQYLMDNGVTVVKNQ